MHICVAVSLPGFGFPGYLTPLGSSICPLCSESTSDFKGENPCCASSLVLDTRDGMRVCYTQS